MSRPTPIALAAHGLCLLLACAAAGAQAQQGAAGATVATSAPRHSHDIAAGSLAPALARYATATGLTLAFTPDLVQGLQTSGLHGSHTIDEGFVRLLAGTGLAAVPRVGGGYTLERSSAAAAIPAAAVGEDYTLREVRVTGRRDGETEGSGSYTTEAITIGKTAQALRELPQSVSVLTQQRLADQNLTSLGKAAEQIVGLTVQDSNYRLPSIYSRGFEINSIQLDGGAPMSTGNYANVAFDLSQYDRVEILRGAAGLLNGTGNPGGAVNLVRKMPTATPQLSVALSGGSWSNYRAEADASGPLAFDGKLRGRAVLAYENRAYFIDHRATEKPSLYAVLEADLGPRAVLAVGLRTQEIHEDGTNNDLPRYSTGADLNLRRSTGLSPGWDFLDGHSNEVFAKLTWRLADRWTLRANAAQTRNNGESLSAFFNDAVDPATGLSTWAGSRSDYRNRQNLLDLNLSGAFTAFGRTHELLAGVDAQDISSRWRSFGAVSCQGSALDVFHPDATPCAYGARPDNLNRIYSPNGTRQYGAYSTLRLDVADGTRLIMGARANRYTYRQVASTLGNDGNWAVQSRTQYTEPTKVVPFAGLVYDIDKAWSAYASYAQVFNPQANLKAGPAPGTGLVPMRGTNLEAGLKGELLGGKLNTALALYRIVQDQRAVQDTRYRDEGFLYGGSCCFLASGRVVSQGLDTEVNGEAAPGVSLMAGYTYNNNRNETARTAFSAITPRHAIKLWGSWQLPGMASAWKLGGGATMSSRQYVSGTATTFNPASGRFDGPDVPYNYAQASYAVWNAMLEYRIDPRWTLALNVSNVFDRTYYRTMGASWGGNYYGEPRNVMLTLRGRY